MSQSFDEIAFGEDIDEVLSSEDAQRWKFEKTGDLEVHLTFYPKDYPEDVYMVRLHWNRYPGEPPSVKFRNIQTGSYEDSFAWPIIPGARPTSFDICRSYCLEGMNLHPEWKNDSKYVWDDTGNVLLKVIRWLQKDLDYRYGGRYK